MSDHTVSPVYKPSMPATWWLRNRKYFLFMLREFSSLFVAIFAVIYALGVFRVAQGKASYDAFVDGLSSPLSRVLSVLILLFSIYHTVTWFQSVGKIMVLRVGGKEVSPRLVFAANCLGWAVISAVLFYLMVRT